MLRFRFSSRLPVPVEELFLWHSRPGAFERLAPPWQRVRVLHRSGTITNGDVLVMQLEAGPLHKKWVALHSAYEFGVQFRDTQVDGPFRAWVHTHRTRDSGNNASILEDELALRLPLDRVVEPILGGIIRSEIRRMFRFRHMRTRLDLWRHQQYAGEPRATVAVLGDHPVADQLRAFLTGGGHEVSVVREASVVVDLSSLEAHDGTASSTPLLRVIRDPGTGSEAESPTTTVEIELPREVVGPSFSGGSPLVLVRERLRSLTKRQEAKDWISEDDLIGIIYHVILRGHSGRRIVASARAGSLPEAFTLALPTRDLAGAAVSGRL